MEGRVSALMLVNAGWMGKDRAVKKAKSFKEEIIDAYRVDTSFPKNKDVNVIMWFMAKSERRIDEIKDEILKTRGVKGLQLKIGSGITTAD